MYILENIHQYVCKSYSLRLDQTQALLGIRVKEFLEEKDSLEAKDDFEEKADILGENLFRKNLSISSSFCKEQCEQEELLVVEMSFVGISTFALRCSV